MESSPPLLLFGYPKQWGSGEFLKILTGYVQNMGGGVVRNSADRPYTASRHERFDIRRQGVVRLVIGRPLTVDRRGLEAMLMGAQCKR